MFGKHKLNGRALARSQLHEWSGVSYAPHCSNGCQCSYCGELLHIEGSDHYCPACDEYVQRAPGCNLTESLEDDYDYARDDLNFDAAREKGR